MRPEHRENMVARLRRARRRGGLEPLRDEGAVALITALCVSTFLLGFTALAVDFGQVYARKGGQQSLADLSALAAATELPSIDAAWSRAFDALCGDGADSEDAHGWEAGTCADRGSLVDGDITDGELTFYRKDVDKDGVYREIDEVLPAEVTALDGQATALRVQLPQTRVTFGLGRTFGADGITLAEVATARVGSALGSGLVPYAVTTTDLTPANQYRFCVKDPDAAELADDYDEALPPPFPFFGTDWPRAPLAPELDPPSMEVEAADRELTLTTSRLFFPLPNPLPVVFPADVRVYFGSSARPLQPTRERGGLQLRVTVPEDVEGGKPVRIWVEWGNGPGLVRSYPATLDIGLPAGATEPCQRVEALRGFGRFARQPAPPNEGAELVANTQRGVQQEVRRWPENAAAIGALTPVLVTLGLFPTVEAARCGIINPLLAGVGLDPVNDALQPIQGGALGYVNCFEARREGFAEDMTEGLLGQGAGRDVGLLTKQCSPSQPQPISGHPPYAVDNTNLLRGSSSPLVNGALGSPDQLRQAIRSGATPQEGWIKNEAFRCGRLVAMPVLDLRAQGGQPTGVVAGDQYPVIDITYAWIDDGSSGLLWSADPQTLRAFRGHVIAPDYFPDVVTDSPVVGEYLGDYLPKQAVLVRDRSDVP